MGWLNSQDETRSTKQIRPVPTTEEAKETRRMYDKMQSHSSVFPPFDEGMPEEKHWLLESIRDAYYWHAAELSLSKRLTDLIAEGGTSWLFHGVNLSLLQPEGEVTHYAVKIAKKPDEISNQQAQSYINSHGDLLKREVLEAQKATFSLLHNDIRAAQLGDGIEYAKMYADLPHTEQELLDFREHGLAMSRIIAVRDCNSADDGRSYIEMQLVELRQRTRDMLGVPARVATLHNLAADGLLAMSSKDRCELAEQQRDWKRRCDRSGVFELYAVQDMPTARSILVESCLGVKELHDSRVLHRDLKLNNVLLYCHNPRQWRIKICDLQTLVALNDKGAYLGPSHGSRYFCSPEQAYNADSLVAESQRVPIGPSADIYAFGCCMLCLVGKATREQLPDADEKGDKDGKAHFDRKMDVLYRTVRPEYLDIVRKATAFRAEERYQSADEMLDALKRVEE